MNNQKIKIALFFALLFFLMPLTGYSNAPYTFSNEYSHSIDQRDSLAAQNYQQLQQMVSVYQHATGYPWTPLPPKAKLKLGAKNPTVLDLRARLTLTRDLEYNNGSDIFDPELMDAVKSFQERTGLEPDGVIGAKTRAELDVPPEERLRQIQINLQRWASLSQQMGDRYVLVNVPDFKLFLIDKNQIILSMKIIAGKPDWQTPELVSRITQLVFNPYWNVPDPIARKDVIPKIINDPGYLAQNNIRVFQGDYESEIDPEQVDWETVLYNGASSDYHFRQDSGETNSLGQVKFQFDNKYSVYLHGTPAIELFSQEERDLSHGCVRLENPFALADYLMQDDPKWSDEKMNQLIAEGKTVYVKVKDPLPIFITYITAWIDESGKLNFRDDIYGRDP